MTGLGYGQPGAVISYGFWQREFAGRPALGQKLKTQRQDSGSRRVTPANLGVAVGDNFDVAVPVCAQPYLETKSILNSSTKWWLSIIGRLDPTTSVQQAAAHLESCVSRNFASTLRGDHPPDRTLDFSESVVGDPVPVAKHSHRRIGHSVAITASNFFLVYTVVDGVGCLGNRGFGCESGFAAMANQTFQQIDMQANRTISLPVVVDTGFSVAEFALQTLRQLSLACNVSCLTKILSAPG